MERRGSELYVRGRPGGTGKARQGKARQGKARQGKARQGKARQGKARQGKARQGKARQQDIPLPERRGELRLEEGVGANRGARGDGGGRRADTMSRNKRVISGGGRLAYFGWNTGLGEEGS
jgi:hypothetical protein